MGSAENLTYDAFLQELYHAISSRQKKRGGKTVATFTDTSIRGWQTSESPGDPSHTKIVVDLKLRQGVVLKGPDIVLGLALGCLVFPTFAPDEQYRLQFGFQPFHRTRRDYSPRDLQDLIHQQPQRAFGSGEVYLDPERGLSAVYTNAHEAVVPPHDLPLMSKEGVGFFLGYLGTAIDRGLHLEERLDLPPFFGNARVYHSRIEDHWPLPTHSLEAIRSKTR